MAKIIMRDILDDIKFIISWRDVARTYFGKSSSWIYHKLDGIYASGDGGFSPEEKHQLKAALYDLADRIRSAADRIPLQ